MLRAALVAIWLLGCSSDKPPPAARLVTIDAATTDAASVIDAASSHWCAFENKEDGIRIPNICWPTHGECETKVREMGDLMEHQCIELAPVYCLTSKADGVERCSPTLEECGRRAEHSETCYPK